MLIEHSDWQGLRVHNEVLASSAYSSHKKLWKLTVHLPKRIFKLPGTTGYLRNLTAAETKFKRVIEMNPYDFQAHLGYAFFLIEHE